MTRHTNQNVPFSMLKVPTAGVRVVTMNSGDTVFLSRGEHHLGITRPDTGAAHDAVILNSPSTFISHSLGHIVTLEHGGVSSSGSGATNPVAVSGGSTDDSSSATIVHGTSGVYFKDGEDLTLSSTCRWVTIVFTGNGWMEIARDGDVVGSGGDLLASTFAADHDATTGLHKTIHQEAARADGDTPFAWTLLHEATGPVDGIVRTYSMTTYGEGYEVTNTVITQNAEIIGIDGFPYLRKDSPLPSWMIAFGAMGFSLSTFAAFDDAPEEPEGTNPVVFSMNRWVTIVGSPSDGEELLRFAKDTLMLAYGEFEETETTTRLYPRSSASVDLGSENNRFRRVATDEILLGEFNASIRRVHGNPTDSATEGSLRLSNDGNAYIRNGEEWKPLTITGAAQDGASCAPAINDCIITDNGDGTLSLTYADFQDSTGNRRAGYGFMNGAWTAAVPGAKTVVLDIAAGTINGMNVNTLPDALGELGYTQRPVPEGQAVYGAVIADRVTGNVFCCRNKTGGGDGDRAFHPDYQAITQDDLNSPNGWSVLRNTEGYSSSTGIILTNTRSKPMHVKGWRHVAGITYGDSPTVKLQAWSIDGGTGLPDSLIAETADETIADTGISGTLFPNEWSFPTPIEVAPGASVALVLARTDAGSTDIGICRAYNGSFGELIGSRKCITRDYETGGWSAQNDAPCPHGVIDVAYDGVSKLPVDTGSAQYRILAEWGPVAHGTTPEFVFSGYGKWLYNGITPTGVQCLVAIAPNDGVAIHEEWAYPGYIPTFRGYAKSTTLTTGTPPVYFIEPGMYHGQIVRVYNRSGATVDLMPNCFSIDTICSIANNKYADIRWVAGYICNDSGTITLIDKVGRWTGYNG